MDVRPAAPAQAQPPSPASPVAGHVQFITAGNEEVIAWLALAALAAADAVLHDGTLDPQCPLPVAVLRAFATARNGPAGQAHGNAQTLRRDSAALGR